MKREDSFTWKSVKKKSKGALSVSVDWANQAKHSAHGASKSDKDTGKLESHEGKNSFKYAFVEVRHIAK